jgi:folate-binding protein YgfZ
MNLATSGVARRLRAYVRVQGPDAEEFLQRMLSNDVSGEVCDALLLTPKARVIAPLRVWRRGDGDFLLLTEPGLGEPVRAALLRARFAAKCEIELEEHISAVVFGEAGGIPNPDYGVRAVEVLDELLAPTVGDDELEVLRITAGTPRFGREIDDRVLPAEAGLEARAIDFEKGCYPGQEPIARQHYRGRVNRTLRRLEIGARELPHDDAELTYDGKVVGRITSAARDGDTVAALGYVRTEVPADAILRLGERAVRSA